MGKKNPCKNAFGTGRACLFQRRFYVLYRKCEEAPAKFRRKGETAAELGKGFPGGRTMYGRGRAESGSRCKGTAGKLKSGEARIPGALSSAERGTALCTSGNFGETRRLQEWGLSRRRAKQFESCVRTSLNPLMGTVILWIANFQCHTVHHGALAADDRQLLLFRKADRFAFV